MALPTPPTPLVDRVDELEAALARLARPDVRLLTLTGTGGAGKTRLALEIATRLAAAFPDGAQLVDLSPVGDPGLVEAAIAEALGLRDAGGLSLPAQLARHLADRAVLLVLDNFEHLLAAGPAVADLLAGSPATKIVATSRTALRVSWEHELPVPPLALPAAGDLDDLAALTRSPAVQLFVDRARAVRADFRLTDENASAVLGICRQLEGLPLSLELAATRLKILPPRAMLARLEHRLGLLTAGPSDRPARHQTLRATIDWSYQLLGAEARDAFRRLAVFVGGFTLDAVEAVCAVPSADALELVGTLVESSLLWQRAGAERDASAGRRFGMLDTIREYALEQLAASQELETSRRRQAEYLARLARRAQAALAGPEQSIWLDRLEREHDNFRAALDWCAERGQVALGLALGGALWRFWYVRGYFGEGRARLDALLALGGDAAGGRAEALNGAGNLAYLQGDHDAAERLHRAALAIRQESDDARGVAASLNNLGLVARGRGDAAAALALFGQALELNRGLGNRAWEALNLGNLGNLAYDRGDLTASRRLRAESLILFAELGDEFGMAMALGDLGDVAYAEGDHAHAAAIFVESLVQRRDIGDRRGLAQCLEGLGALALARSQSERGVGLIAAAAAAREVIGAPHSPARRARVQRLLEEARTRLGEASYEAAWRRGHALTTEAAIAEALPADPPRPRVATADPLTPREREVAALIARGLSNREIAARLVISERTADSHVANILGKLEFTARAQVAAWATSVGLAPAPG